MTPGPETFAELRVVVVDDSRTFQQMLRMVLRSFGVRRIDVASEVAEVRPLFEQHPFDLALVDLVMTAGGGTRTSGIDIIAAARRNKAVVNRQMPMVLTTGHANRAVIEAAMAAGADHVLAKPLSARALLACLTALAATPRAFVRGPDGYFGPDVTVALQRIAANAPLAALRGRARAPAPAPSAAPLGRSRSPQVPGLGVPIRDDGMTFLD